MPRPKKQYTIDVSKIGENNTFCLGGNSPMWRMKTGLNIIFRGWIVDANANLTKLLVKEIWEAQQ